MKRAAALSIVAGLSIISAGCGGKSSPSSVASVATTTTTTTTSSEQSGLVAFSSCMRTHGMPSFPDPQRLNGANVKLTIKQSVGDNPRYRTALNTCSPLLPQRGGTPETAQQQRTQLADELSFARCMRNRGVSSFPDPNGQGQLSVAMVQAAGIDVHSPQVLRVVQTCIPASHGGLTIAKVREALNGGG